MSRPAPGSISADDLTRLLRAIEESKLVEVELDYAGLHVRVRKDGATDPPRSIPRNAEHGIPENVVDRGEPTPTSVKRVEVRAPMLGIFYRASQPGAPPFVEAGQIIRADDTIGLIEVMKLYNQVPAGVDGRVVEIAVEDASFVEHGQVLLIVEPPQ